ncbi:MAG: hypothetical protein ACM3SW_18960 [Actinomycetota bacterium]
MISLSATRKWVFLGWICAVCLTAGMAHAQTPTPTPTPAAQDTGAATKGKTDGGVLPQDTRLATPATATQPDDSQNSQVSDEVLQTTSPPTVDHPAVRELGGHGRFFSDNVSWLHWGPVGVRSAEAFYTYATLDQQDSSAHLSATTLQTNIAYSQRLARSRLIWQYNPRVLIVNGHVSSQTLNQDSTLDMLFAPTSRLTWGISNWLNYYGRDNGLNDRTLDHNNFSGAISNPFLNNGASTLVDSVALPISYNFSARTTISVSPFFGYTRSSELAAPNSGLPDTLTIASQAGARTQFTHAVSPRQSLGFYATYQRSLKNNIEGPASYESFGGTWTRRVGMSFGFVVEGGGSHSVSNALESWTGVGSLTITKSFRHSSLDATYGRNVSFSGLFGNGYNDYARADYNHQFGRRLSASASFGYLTGPSLGGTATGKYVNGSVNYFLYSNLSWFFGYSRYMQGGNGQLIVGDQSQFQTGLSWSPRRKPAL